MPLNSDQLALAEKIDRALPQTQCEQCEFKGCYEYAKALVKNETDINRCPPGGAPVIRALAELLDRDPLPLDRECGEYTTPQVVFIEEDICIGCAKCLQACPIDAIVGTHRLMHTVIEAECTGCELCIPPCPMNCIQIKKIDYRPKLGVVGLSEPQLARAPKARERFNARKKRNQTRESITETQLPEATRRLADRTSPSNMMDLIEQATQKFKDHYE